MSFSKHLSLGKKNSTYTLMIIPGKYGTAKSLLLPKWLVWISILLFLSISIALFMFFYDYSDTRKQNIKSMEDIELLKKQTNDQQQEIKSYEEIEEELKSKLEELKIIEEQLKKRLSSSMEPKMLLAAAPTSSHVNLQELDVHIENLYTLIGKYDQKVSEERRIPSVLPCHGRISSYFGRRTNPVSRGRTETHHGIDITNSYRTTIKASADGVVEFAGWLKGYGYAIIINHENGYTSLYGHNSKLLVKKYQRVKRGQAISLMGSTGRSTGTHVHFEVRINGQPVNPLKITKGGNL